VPVGKSTSAAKVVSGLTVTSPTAWRLTIDPRYKSLLQLRLTNVPGWEATIDGRPLTLRSLDSVMLQATVPAGRSVIQLVYRPKAYAIGLDLALGAVVALVGASVVAFVARRRRARRPPRLSLRSGTPTLLPETRPLVGV